METFKTLMCLLLLPDRMESFWVQTAMGALKAAVFVYDVISFPIYFLLQRPWKRRTLAKRIKVGKHIHYVTQTVMCLCYVYRNKCLWYRFSWRPWLIDRTSVVIGSARTDKKRTFKLSVCYRVQC
jgi:hypothetical protein